MHTQNSKMDQSWHNFSRVMLPHNNLPAYTLIEIILRFWVKSNIQIFDFVTFHTKFKYSIFDFTQNRTNSNIFSMADF